MSSSSKVHVLELARDVRLSSWPVGDWLTRVVVDYKDGTTRSTRTISSNEIVAMALNELAAQHRHGFLFHMNDRMVWDKTQEQGRKDPLIAARVTEATKYRTRVGHGVRAAADFVRSAKYPDLVFMRYGWSEAGSARFFDSSHKYRLQASHAISNPPAHETPIYPIQLATGERDAIYSTDYESLVLICSSEHAYLFTMSALEEVVPRAQKRRRLKGEFAHLRLALPSWLWGSDEREGRGSSRPAEIRIQDAFLSKRFSDPAELYRALCEMCVAEKLTSAMTFGQLLSEAMPRPANAKTETQPVEPRMSLHHET